MLNDRKILQKIKELNLETIPFNIFKDIEKIFQNEAFDFSKIKNYSPCLYHLICWEMGVIEYHRTVRNYCLNYYDMKILSKEEIIFFVQMDNIYIMYNKLKYYSYMHCKEFQNDAIRLMNEINSGIFEEKENEDVINNSNQINEKINKINENENNILKDINSNDEINKLEDSIEE